MRKKFLIAMFLIGLMSMPAHSGLPVIDSSNLVQNIMVAIESIGQTLKQIDQYQTQLQQYENQLQNSMTPDTYTWDRARNTINELLIAIDTLEYYKQQIGSIDKYLSKFQDVSYYSDFPCLSSRNCTEKERAELAENRRLASESQKRTNDAVLRGIDRQQDALRKDAQTLEGLQTSAQSAIGQMEAIQYANQFASQQSHQLLEIRGLLVAQQNTIVTRNQALVDREAQQAVSAEKLREGGFRPSPDRAW
jgi:type IV secretion system protein TrbJ